MMGPKRCGESREATCGREHGSSVYDAAPATIFVSDRGAGEREECLRQIRAYLYGGWDYAGWGSDPCGRMPGAGFLFTGPASGGFGAEALLARLGSGLHFGHVCGGAE